MIKTKMCELLGVTHPVIQAVIGPFSFTKAMAAGGECAEA